MRRARLLALLTMLLAASLLTGPSQPVQAAQAVQAGQRACAQRTPGFHTSTMRAGGVVRSYTVYVPPTWSPRALRPPSTSCTA